MYHNSLHHIGNGKRIRKTKQMVNGHKHKATRVTLDDTLLPQTKTVVSATYLHYNFG